MTQTIITFLFSLSCRLDAIQSGFGLMEDSYLITDLQTGDTFNIFISEYSEEKVRERVGEIRFEFGGKTQVKGG
jgi:hypothetical protein